jgi:hypothetical protein
MRAQPLFVREAIAERDIGHVNGVRVKIAAAKECYRQHTRELIEDAVRLGVPRADAERAGRQAEDILCDLFYSLDERLSDEIAESQDYVEFGR